MALGINGVNQNNIFAAKPAETVTGAELSKTVQEILSAKTSSVSFKSSSSNNINFGRSSVDVSLYGTNASSDTNAVKLAATNKAGYEINLNQTTLSAVNALNASAANNAINNVAQLRNGLIHINAEKPDFSVLKNTFALNNSTQVFESMNLSKDRKGSSPFYVPRQTKNDSEVEKTEGLNLVA